MKKKWLITLAAIALCFAALGGMSALAEEPAEWTVLFYFCGSDLESKYSYATGNLEEISGVYQAESMLPAIATQHGETVDPHAVRRPGRINVLIETGGCAQWHAQPLGMEIAADAIQRWRYNIRPATEKRREAVSGFELLDTLPLQSMADPETLGDFISWGAETCPAKKYALVLWDHGGGSKTGLFADELFDGDWMPLYDLFTALKLGDIHFETVLIDACMMANVETAWMISDYADWLVASEEAVPGKGTAVGSWLQELVNHAECGGELLGRNLCDMTLMKYANQDDRQARAILTWSVIDLSGIDPVVEALDRLFNIMGKAYEHYPELIEIYANWFSSAEQYGDGRQDMLDIGSVIHNRTTASYMDVELRNDILDALAGAVAYVVRGAGRSEALGLSICYPVASGSDEIEIYSHVCPSDHYLALLDALSDWRAPEALYDRVGRLPEIDEVETMTMSVVRRMSNGDMPAVEVKNITRAHDVYYCLYRRDELTGQVLRMGRTPCRVDIQEDDSTVLFVANEPWRWPAIQGVPCDMEYISRTNTAYRKETLYNIPVLIDSQVAYLRCGRSNEIAVDEEAGDFVVKPFVYDVYGVWEGYDENSVMMNRNVKDLSRLAGLDFQLLYPTDEAGEGGGTIYGSSAALTMYRALDIEEMTIPAGSYYLQYEVEDIFHRRFALERIEMAWDGEQLSFPEGFAWDGEVTFTRQTSGRF